ncbi:MAG: hypothetical protein IJT39_01890 [Bacteroidales bacterium]|nr:hypothetical protein [Bacteroidales bacterium]
MGTPACVSVRIKPENRGLARFYVKEWRAKPERGYYDTECNLIINDNVMTSSIHFDGYLEEVGRRLFKEIRSYQEAFEFILKGDRSSFDLPYYERNESWESNKPQMVADFPDNSTIHDYYYKWDKYEGEEQWMVRKYSETEYTPLKRFFIGMNIEIQQDNNRHFEYGYTMP